ncbi:MAG: hypothetical protein M3Y42_07985 [Actinomycetota bacterium]|nr:hypothetical protein [Actinomycetota bacterium]MDQ2956888.1 hypothetical protein [Actinomycetota bacterium]
MAEPVAADSTAVADRFTANRRVWRRVFVYSAIGLAVGVAASVLGSLTSSGVSPTLWVAVPVTLAVLLALMSSTYHEMAPVEDWAPAPPASGEEYFVKLRQLERRLQGASVDSEKFEWNVRPVLTELAAERLRHRHGINFAREAEQARAIVGEQLWQMMTTPQNGPPSAHQLHELVAAIEAI